MVCLMVCLEHTPFTGNFHLLFEHMQTLEDRDLVFCADELNDDVVYAGDIPGQ